MLETHYLYMNDINARPNGSIGQLLTLPLKYKTLVACFYAGMPACLLPT